MSWFRKFVSYIPRPFKSLQRALDIQHQWTAFKANISPHKFKIFLICAIATYPIYQNRLFLQINNIKHYFYQSMQSSLQPEKPIPQIAENYIKQIVDSVLKDKNIKNEASSFVNDLTKRDMIQKGVLDLLLSVVKNPIFIQEAQQLGKKIVIQNSRDKAIEEQLKKLVIKVLQSYQVQQEVKSLIQIVFSSQKATQTLVKLLATSVNDQRVKAALGQSFKYAFSELLYDVQTVDQIKIFAIFLLRTFQKDQQIKDLMSTVLQKGIGLKKKKKTDQQLQRILKGPQTK